MKWCVRNKHAQCSYIWVHNAVIYGYSSCSFLVMQHPIFSIPSFKQSEKLYLPLTNTSILKCYLFFVCGGGGGGIKFLFYLFIFYFLNGVKVHGILFILHNSLTLTNVDGIFPSVFR